MAETNGNRPVTRDELHAEMQALEERLETRLTNTLIKVLAQTQAEILAQTQEYVRNSLAQTQAEILAQTQEYVRDAQTELLRGFGSFLAGQNVQFRKLKADLSNVDASTDLRLQAMEQRLFEIEKRLGPPPPPQSNPPASAGE